MTDGADWISSGSMLHNFGPWNLPIMHDHKTEWYWKSVASGVPIFKFLFSAHQSYTNVWVSIFDSPIINQYLWVSIFSSPIINQYLRVSIFSSPITNQYLLFTLHVQVCLVMRCFQVFQIHRSMSHQKKFHRICWSWSSNPQWKREVLNSLGIELNMKTKFKIFPSQVFNLLKDFLHACFFLLAPLHSNGADSVSPKVYLFYFLINRLILKLYPTDFQKFSVIIDSDAE